MVESVNADDIGQPLPTSMISLTENYECQPIANFPSTNLRAASGGVISNGRPTFCGGEKQGWAGANECWKYDKSSDSWEQAVSMNQGRYGFSILKLDDQDFMVLGERNKEPSMLILAGLRVRY